MLMVLVLVYFFFFKQKPAYELRISDWSSHVCSSDLDVSRDFTASPGGSEIATYVIPTRSRIPKPKKSGQEVGGGGIAQKRAMDGPRPASEIGRASWRERVCQYV